MYENSLIIFTSDNGGLTTQKKVAPTSVYPLRAGKGWLYEGGIKIPQLIKPPENIKNEKINDLTVSYDLFPTILDFAGIENNEKIDGVSLMPRLKNQSKIDREDIFGISLIITVVNGNLAQQLDLVIGNYLYIMSQIVLKCLI